MELEMSSYQDLSALVRLVCNGDNDFIFQGLTELR